MCQPPARTAQMATTGRRLGSITWRTRQGSNADQQCFLSVDHEHVLVYGNPGFAFNGFAKSYEMYGNPDNDPRGDWMSDNLYTEADFRLALRRAVEAAWMRDTIAAGVPETGEQVHARQILLYNSGDANQVYSQLQSGQDFADLAADYDPVAEGELGWFPRGYLTQLSAVEEAAFVLEPGQYSPLAHLAGKEVRWNTVTLFLTAARPR